MSRVRRKIKCVKYFSTFSGIGGFELGIQNAYRSTLRIGQEDKTGDKGQRLFASEGKDISSKEGRPRTSSSNFLNERPLCIGYSEIDKYAIKVYERQFPNVRNYGDITKIKAEELPDFDCLVGGFPCQAFSIAGKRKGFDDTRGTLFFDLARILRAKQPRLFVFENVKGLLSHDNGNTFRTIIATIAELGYDCQWQVVNSKNHGVPQNRERVIIVGHLRGTSRPQVFPITGANRKDTRIIGQDVAYTIDANYHKGTNTLAKSRRSLVQVGTLRIYNDGNGFREMKTGLAPTIPSRAREDGSGQPVIIAAQRWRYNNGGKIEQQLEPRFDGVSNTLTAVQKDNMLYKPMIRRLTPIECERLQGFPDDWTKYGMGGVLISDTQRYKMCGNAVTTNVIQSVFERIFA